MQWTLLSYLSSLSSPQAKKLFLLPGDKINPGVFKQCSKYKEQTDSHPDINGFYIRDLQKQEENKNTSAINLGTKCLQN